MKNWERFIAKVAEAGPGGCWLWTAYRQPDGYGVFWDGSHYQNGHPRQVLAHRWAYGHFVADPGDVQVLHYCDTPPCVNPAHLFLGSQTDNIADMDAKGRRGSTPGERNAASKLTADQVAEIRAAWTGAPGELAALGRAFGVHYGTIARIVKGTGWRQVA